MAQEKKYDVFISYSRKDSAIADEIRKAFDQVGITYFIDREEIKIEKDYIERIANGIDNSKIVLFLASTTSYTSKYVNIELQYAFDKEVLILPYQIDNAAITKKYQMLLSSVNWYNINEHPINPTLIETIAEHVEKEIDFDEINKSVEPDPPEVKKVVNKESKIRAPKRLNHLSLRKILLSVCFSLISIIIVLGTSYTIACNTLRYEYDYSQNAATVVAKKPFFRCSGYVNIPERVKYEGQYFEVCYIGEGAFINNSKLTSVTIPNGVIGIGKRAFAGCPSLTTVTIPHSVLHVGDYAFSKCSSLNSINIQEGTKSIGEGAFYDCKNIKSVDIPNSVTTIGEGAFYDCYGLKSITIGKNVKTIGNRAFYDCHKLTSLTISDSVTSIGDDAFYDCHGLKSITIGKNVKTIGNRAFRGCTSLSDITIPNNVTTIGYAAFKYCLNIQSLTIGNGVICIKSSAFEDCNKLMTVTIPKSVTEIGKNAFPMHTKIIRE